MRELLTVITRKGQITVPAEIRRALGLKEGDKVALTMENHEVRLRRAGSVVERTAGILRGDEPVLSAEELRVAAERAIAEATVERMGG
ncbi:MAG: AbrB/MazE/SpoVT family DNA-binding domain-containing protein [Chloroflexi bacterium]|nr:AbrB/MazE/SpoVT family DNA-binding domain-containing protein [Chloroflexota bacterium]